MNRPPKSSRLRAAAITTLLGLALSGCARINDVGKLLLASSMPAVALVNDTLLVGDATLFMDRSGRLSLESSTPGLLKCMGEMRYTATQTGVVNLRCSDGTEARLLFSTLSEVMGFGSGSSARGPVTLTFGMEPTEAAAYLNLPAGQRIVSSFEGGTRLEPLSSPGVTP